MCGIVGYSGRKNAAQVILSALSNLEYRGYDSAGMALWEGGSVRVIKAQVRLENLRRLAEHGERETAVREILETGQLAQEVSDAYVTLGAVTQSREGTRLTLAAEAYVTVLYRTEDGACSSVTRQLQAACPLELPEDASCTCLCSCTAPVLATPTAGGIEVRFSLSFSYTALTSRTAAAVAAVQLDENAAADHAGQPSIVLRVVGAGERLWDIAKAYGTTSRDIVQANGLEEELAPEGQLLLIPRKR